MARKKQHYVDNERFLEVMSDYREKYLQAKDDEEELPVIPDYAGECFLKIAERLSHRPNFINYAFKDDMISDGIENCLHYIHNFKFLFLITLFITYYVVIFNFYSVIKENNNLCLN